LVESESTGGQEWRLGAALDDAGVVTRQLPTAQIKAFSASRGTCAKADRIDAELTARFMALRSDAGLCLPHKLLRHLRATTFKRVQLVETRKRLLREQRSESSERRTSSPQQITSSRNFSTARSASQK
jgi:transposase